MDVLFLLAHYFIFFKTSTAIKFTTLIAPNQAFCLGVALRTYFLLNLHHGVFSFLET